MGNFEVIAKFGGTSVAQPELVREHVQYEEPPIVVVSAPGIDEVRGHTVKVTDMLLEMKAGQAGPHPLLRRFNGLAERMGQPQINRQIINDLAIWQHKGQPIEALGERWAAQLYAGYLGRQFVDAAEVIRFDESGHLDVSASERLIRLRFEIGERYVVPGFYGADARGNIHVLSRGGSDITPALIGRAMGVEENHNWSDVDGFMTADPRYFQDAELLECRSYEQVSDAAERGCQLLHPEVCRLLGGTAVTTVMRNTFGELGNRGTEIADPAFVAAGNEFALSIAA